MKRVVITGAGVVSPIGNTLQEFMEGIATGRKGIAAISLGAQASCLQKMRTRCPRSQGQASCLQKMRTRCPRSQGQASCLRSPPGRGDNVVDLRENSSPPLVGGVRGGGTRQHEISGKTRTFTESPGSCSPPPNLPLRQAQDRLHQGGGT
jgi:hypothetical protein